MIDLSDDFASYHVCDSSGNPLGRREDTKLHHPDDALRLAVEVVTRTWEDWECARIVGTISGERVVVGDKVLPADEGAELVVEVEETVVILAVYRDGPPGSRKVRLVHPSYPWISTVIDADEVKRPPAGARL